MGPQSHGTGILRRGGGNDTGHISFLYHVCTEERPYEDTLGRPPHASQEEPSPETRPDDTLILDFQPPQPRGNNVCRLSHPDCAILDGSPSTLTQFIRKYFQKTGLQTKLYYC